MSLPINGRIAIIDDQIKHAEPLMKIFSKRQIPFTYFSGEYNYLPVSGENKNDIRVLFLDINLIDDGEHPDKVLKARLLPVLESVISEDNYPYVIIYWSRHQTKRDKDLIEKEIFGKELVQRRPIAFLSAIKSDYFNLDGSFTDDYDDKINVLFKNIASIISKHSAYCYLLNWENKVHLSADKTLEEIFSSYNKFENWADNANYVINKLGLSYSGKAFNTKNAENKIKSSYNALNIVFSDTLENATNNCKILNSKVLKVSSSTQNLESISSINKKLLISDENDPIFYSGAVIELTGIYLNIEYESLLDTILKSTAKRNDIVNKWKKIWLNVTPLCDSVQGKVIFHRLIRGFLIPKEYHKTFHTNEAVYISPPFVFEKIDYCIVLDFRQFFTLAQMNKSKNRKSIFRVRQQLLAEIQSKLSRHINRQGILFLDDRK